MHYGERLGVYEPNIEAVYQYFNAYFSNPTMYKVKDVKDLSLYMSKVYCLLNKECRYVVSFVIMDSFPIHTKRLLKDLPWVSLQTRTLADNHKLPAHSYQPKATGPLSVSIKRVEMTDTASTYTCEDLPIMVTLLHTKPGDKMEYQEFGTIVTALETYNTVITLTN